MIYVVAQFICIFYLIINADFSQFGVLNGLLLIASAVLGAWAVLNMRLDNLNIQPQLKGKHKLITHGIYHSIRHPIYTAVIMGMLAVVLTRPQIEQWLAYLLLIVILSLKSNKEEFYLMQRFNNYKNYKRKTGKFLPFL